MAEKSGRLGGDSRIKKETSFDICKSIENFVAEIELSFEVAPLSVLDGNGRGKDAHILCKHGKYIYVLKDINDKILYVGETQTSVKNRCIGDGSGAHKNKNWYGNVSSIDYYNAKNLTLRQRKLIERALIIKLEPQHNYI